MSRFDRDLITPCPLNKEIKQMKPHQISRKSPWRQLPRLAALAALVALLLAAAVAAPAQADFGFESFGATLSNDQAGAPVDLATSFRINRVVTPEELSTTEGSFKNLSVDLPAGIIGNATAVPRCKLTQLYTTGACPAETQVGVITAMLMVGGPEPYEWHQQLYNMVPDKDETAQLVANFFWGTVHLRVRVRDDGDYGLTTEVRNAIDSFPMQGTDVEIWGIPADSSHDELRGSCLLPDGPSGSLCPSEGEERKAYLRNPSVCGPLDPARITMNEWRHPETVATETATLKRGKTATDVNITGCDQLPAPSPSGTVAPEDSTAGQPTGYGMNIEVPQRDDSDRPATPPLSRVSLQLPEGTSISPGVANGLGACTDEQLHAKDDAPAACPDASKIGTVSVTTPSLFRPLEGSLYVGQPQPANLYRLFMVAEGEGVSVRLKGSAVPDSDTGRLTATFDGLPPFGFSLLNAHLKGGPRAVLVNPTSCGPAMSSGMVTPYGGGADAMFNSTFDVVSCGASGFSPGLKAGSTNPIAGASSPFTIRITRNDGEQQLGSIDLSLPPGQLAKLRGVPYCPDATLAGISGAEGAAAAEAASPSCPSASQVGSVLVGAGAGSSPFYVGGKAYLAGPYKGAPLSIAFVTPALAGPFDLGNVVVRSALKVNPVTAQVEAVSDPLPTILHGVPLALKDVRVSLDRSDFTVNPTSCEEMQVAGQVSSSTGTVADVSNRYQLGDCASLGFKPHLALSLSGPTHRSAHPALRAVLKMPKGNANIGKAVVTLPATEFLENAHIRTVCTRVQYAADNCPKGSVYGYAKAWSPLLDKPLQGPVYLRSSKHTLPDLVASLDGQIHIDLAGRIDSVNERIRNTFWAVPDAPVSKFVLNMQGGKKGLLVNNTDVCGAKPRAAATFTGHNGKVSRSNPLVKADCGGKGAKRHTRHRR